MDRGFTRNPLEAYVSPWSFSGMGGLGQAINPGDVVNCDATGNCFNLTTGEIVSYGGTTGATPGTSPVGAGTPPPCVFSSTPVPLLPGQVYCGTGTTTAPSQAAGPAGPSGAAPAPFTTGLLAVVMGGIFLLFLVMGARRG